MPLFRKSDPPEAAPLLNPRLEITNPNREGVIFQKSDPPEAAPLLAPCLKVTKNLRKVLTEIGGVIFQKSDPPEAAPLLAQNMSKKETNQGGAIFQKSDPPEAAPLLDLCLKGAFCFAKIDKILKQVPFFKSLPRRRQHPC